MTTLTSWAGLLLHTESSAGPPPGASKLPCDVALSTTHRAYEAVGVTVGVLVLVTVLVGVPVPVVEDEGVPVPVPDWELEGVWVDVRDDDGVPVCEELGVPVPVLV